MSIFNFLKPKKPDGMAELLRDRGFQRHMLVTKLDFVKKEVENLRVVGRGDEATKKVGDFLQETLIFWKGDVENPHALTFVVNIAMNLQAYQFAIYLLNSVIESSSGTRVLDLTFVYTDLGRVYHQLRNTPEKELLAYEMAVEAKAPPSCKFPATNSDKALAHNFAYGCANRLNQKEKMSYHASMRKKFVPEIDWDDPLSALNWMKNRIENNRNH